MQAKLYIENPGLAAGFLVPHKKNKYRICFDALDHAVRMR